MRSFCAHGLPFPPTPAQSRSVSDTLTSDVAPLSAPPLPRLDALDLLRGVAILGILLMNTQSMSMPAGAYYSPVEYGDYTGANRIVWMVIHVLADTKFITIFSMLFGAGILLQGERVTQRGLSPAGVHYRRMLVLLLFGIIHAYALWYGDVLIPYAVCGMLLFPIRRLPAPLLVFVGVVFVATATFMRFAIDNELFSLASWIGNWTSQLQSGRTGVAYELNAYRGNWWRQMDSRLWVSLDNDGPSFLTWTLWRCGGCMLIGIALQRSRFFHAQWPRSAYAMLAAMLIPIGWCITGLGIVYNESNGWDATAFWSFGEQFNYWGSLISAFGYLALGVLVAISIADARGIFTRTLRLMAIPIRSIGRTALSNYISQTLVCTTIFYGHGLGRFGTYSRVQLLELTIKIWICQLIVSTIWLRCFKQGPLEWAWHRIAYWSRQASSAPMPTPATA